MLIPLPHAAHLVMYKISVGRDPKNLTTSFNDQNPTHSLNGQNPSLVFNSQNPTLASMVQSQLTSFQILRFSGPFLPGMTSFTHQHYFLSGGLLWQMVTVISFARERKTAPNDYASGLLTQIVQSPTKLNDKIWLTKNDFKKIIP